MSAPRVYLMSDRNVSEINRRCRSKNLRPDSVLHFTRTRHGVAFDHHAFFSFNDLSDPGKAYETLKRAQEAVS
ncbi:MAG: hypothetical protein AAGF79_21670 [Pseudomonadota bacterium]